jgi:PAS domain S-box-containing protein
VAVKTDRLRALRDIEAAATGAPEPREPEPLPLLNFDEEQLRAERLARDQVKREQTEGLLERLSLDIYDRWTELAAESGQPPTSSGTAPAGNGGASVGNDQIRGLLLQGTVPDAILTFGAGGLIQTFNAGAERMFGRSAAEVLGRPIAELLPTRSAEDSDLSQLDALDAGPEGRRVRERLALRADGSELAVEVSIGVLDLEGRRHGAAVIRDISERKQFEQALHQLNDSLRAQVQATHQALEQLQQTQHQLVRAERLASLGGLVAGVAHEINTPIGITLTAASHLHDEAERLVAAMADNSLKRSQLETFAQTFQQSANLVLGNARRAAELIQSFKRVAVDQTSEERRRLHFREYLEEIITSLSPQLKKTAHQIRIDCDPQLEIDTLPGAISQIITNLVLNSLSHAYTEGEAGHIAIEVRRQGARLKLSYRDDGCGIPAEILPQIFDPFFTTKRGAGGTGLGLHIVFGLVHQQLHGSIEAHSTPGQGTEFVLDLPVEIPASSDPDPLPGEPHD